MPTPINQTLKDAERLTRQVTGAMTEHAVPAARKLDVDRQAQGKAPYKKADSLLATSENLQGEYDGYSDAQERVQREERKDGGVKKGRDTHRDTLRQSTSRLARSIETTYGRDGLVATNLAGTVPIPPETLVAFVKGFLNITGVEGFELPTPVNPHATLDFLAARAEIVEQFKALKLSLKSVTVEEKKTQQARSDRDVAYDAWRTELRFARNETRSILVRVGKDDLADRILPTDRQIDGDDPLEEDDKTGQGDGLNDGGSTDPQGDPALQS